MQSQSDEILYVRCSNRMKEKIRQLAKEEKLSMSDYTRNALSVLFELDEPEMFRKSSEKVLKPKGSYMSQKVSEVREFLIQSDGSTLLQIAEKFNYSYSWAQMIVRKIENLKVKKRESLFGAKTNSGAKTKIYGFFEEEKKDEPSGKVNSRERNVRNVNIGGVDVDVVTDMVYRRGGWVMRASGKCGGRKFSEHGVHGDDDEYCDLVDRLIRRMEEQNPITISTSVVIAEIIGEQIE
jgi:DNA-binding Lrp family transcriptional regulator